MLFLLTDFSHFLPIPSQWFWHLNVFFYIYIFFFCLFVCLHAVLQFYLRFWEVPTKTIIWTRKFHRNCECVPPAVARLCPSYPPSCPPSYLAWPLCSDLNTPVSDPDRQNQTTGVWNFLTFYKRQVKYSIHNPPLTDIAAPPPPPSRTHISHEMYKSPISTQVWKLYHRITWDF